MNSVNRMNLRSSLFILTMLIVHVLAFDRLAGWWTIIVAVVSGALASMAANSFLLELEHILRRTRSKN